MCAASRTTTARLPAQYSRFHHSQLYERAQQWPVCPRGGQVRVPSCQQWDTHIICSVTFFDDPLQRIRLGQIAQVPILLGSMEDDGSIFVLNTPNNLSTFLAEQLGSGPLESLITPALVRALYPGLSDSQVIAAVARDITFRWCAVPLLI
jgi:carboxylesterase type B